MKGVNVAPKLEKIGFYTLSDYRAEHVSLESPLWRCELLLTDACNFSCPYCRGMRDDCKGTMSKERAFRVIKIWGDGGLKNVRLSGGEPTLFPYLVDLVKYAKEVGIERVAISTNGSADMELYTELINAGVDDFSISLDACCASTGDIMAGGKEGAWETVTNNIKKIAALTYVTVGVVLTDENWKELTNIITYASVVLKVQDIRIINAAQWETEDKFAKLLAISSNTSYTDHPILNYRIKNFRNGDAVRGLQPHDCHKCHLTLDDMAIAGNYHFPCIIAFREGCAPIGTVDGKSIEEIRQERLLWMLGNDTHCQPICKKNCLDVCVDYNNKVESFGAANG